jgi:hypothetical protein
MGSLEGMCSGVYTTSSLSGLFIGGDDGDGGGGSDGDEPWSLVGADNWLSLDSASFIVKLDPVPIDTLPSSFRNLQSGDSCLCSVSGSPLCSQLFIVR